MSLFVDRIHRVPRQWSNRELERFAGWFDGDVVNVSAWKDIDKEGRKYRDYFAAARSYTITNFRADARGWQGQPGEIFLDLEQPLPEELRQRFDVAWNHTTLEHVYRAETAFRNICAMSRDVVLLVTPFLQPYHGDYGDYWRFTPLLLKRWFEDEGFTLIYQSFNNEPRAAVYVLTFAARHPERWKSRVPNWEFNLADPLGGGAEPWIGCRALAPWHRRLRWRLAKAFGGRKG